MDANILVVDDEPEIADLVEVYLTSEGCAVHTCGTGSQALEVLREQKLDLAILDVMLPDISGFTLCSEIRREHHFPVIMLTARTAYYENENSENLGARRLHAVLEHLLKDVLYEADDNETKQIKIDKDYVAAHLATSLRAASLKKYIL